MADFRIFQALELEPDPEGTTMLVGPNAVGKTTVLEAVAYLGTHRSFRGSPREALVRSGCSSGVVRAEMDVAGRAVLAESEVVSEGRSRSLVNRQPVRGRQDLLAVVPVTAFTPSGLEVVQGGPSLRRELLDDAGGLLDRRSGALVEEVQRILRQRGALLHQAGGRLNAEITSTLDVWDQRLAAAGSELASQRELLVGRLQAHVAEIYASLAVTDDRPAGHGEAERAVLTYRRSWEGDLGPELERRRKDDLRRGTTSVGPHRDELEIRLGQRDARIQASQGEQRCLALALRLGVHRLVTEERDLAPILLLDDVFSELDPFRTRALVGLLPQAQALITSAVPLPEGVEVSSVLDVRELATQ